MFIEVVVKQSKGAACCLPPCRWGKWAARNRRKLRRARRAAARRSARHRDRRSKFQPPAAGGWANISFSVARLCAPARAATFYARLRHARPPAGPGTRSARSSSVQLMQGQSAAALSSRVGGYRGRLGRASPGAVRSQRLCSTWNKRSPADANAASIGAPETSCLLIDD